MVTITFHLQRFQKTASAGGKIQVDEVLESLDDEANSSGPLPRRRFKSKALDKEGWAAWKSTFQGGGRKPFRKFFLFDGYGSNISKQWKSYIG